MDSPTLDRVAELVRQADAQKVVIGDQEYTTVVLHDPRRTQPMPEPYGVKTLTGLVEYLTRNRDGVKAPDVLVHVEGPHLVSVYGKLFGHFQQRNCYVTAVAALPTLLLNTWMQQEDFVIGLQTLFADAGDRGAVVKLAGNLTESHLQTMVDDGITQEVSAKTGVTVVERAEVPNPVQLAPYRTFMEVEQVVSPFVFRVRRGRAGPELALFEADGGKWRLEAITRVRDYLRGQLDGWDIIA